MNIKRILPIVGIVAFSLCSTYSLFHLLVAYAKDDTPLFWIPAIAIELFTAWAVYNVVEQARQVTRSNISKQDRRFYGLVLALFLIVAVPTLAASVVANTLEFGGSILLGLLFPMTSVGCAIGAALPDTVSRYDSQRQAEASKAQAERKRAQEERKAEASRIQAEAREAQARRKQLSSLGKAEATFVKLCQDPGKSLSSIAQELSISRQSVSNHVAKLERAGAIRRNGEGLEILWR
jgi:DNA-binding transcriptional ArsR family regulator